jgi:hypothetical protein
VVGGLQLRQHRRVGDHIFNANASAVHKSRKAGVTLFASRRYRQEYDHNGDGFSELPRINNLSFGLNSFVKTGENAKLRCPSTTSGRNGTAVTNSTGSRTSGSKPNGATATSWPAR